jgi:hypothetical protein
MDRGPPQENDVHVIESELIALGKTQVSWGRIVIVASLWAAVFASVQFINESFQETYREFGLDGSYLEAFQASVGFTLLALLMGVLSLLSTNPINQPSRRVSGSIGESLSKFPTILRTALYCSLWIWRPPTWPSAILVSVNCPHFTSREAYMDGRRLQDGYRMTYFIILAICLGVPLILEQLPIPSRYVQSILTSWISLAVFSIGWAWITKMMCNRFNQE